MDGFCKRLARVAAVYQRTRDVMQVAGAAVERGQSTVAVRDVGRRYRDAMRQPLGVDRDVALDAAVTWLLNSRFTVRKIRDNGR